jgi:hypothetical protein
MKAVQIRHVKHVAISRRLSFFQMQIEVNLFSTTMCSKRIIQFAFEFFFND